MRASSFLVAATAAVAITAPAPKARAGDELAIAGGLIIGGLIINDIVQQNRRKAQAQAQAAYYAGQQSQQTVTRSAPVQASKPKKKTYSISSAQRAENRQVQTALNFFGYDAGTVDGVLGSNSRAAVSRYQSDMSDPADGTLTDGEREFLLSSYQRAKASSGVPRYDAVLAQEGPAALLKLFRDERDSVALPAAQTASATVPAPEVARAATSGVTLGAEGDGPKQVTLLPLPLVRPGACDDVRGDGSLAWQHCMARSNAIAEAATLEAAVTNMTGPEIEAHCEGISAAMAPFRDDLSGTRPGRMETRISDFLAEAGLPADQAIDTAQVCLGVGYRSEDPEMTLGSALMLVGAGSEGYAEIVGHQLRDSDGVSQADPQTAKAWIRMALDSAASADRMVLGQTPSRMTALRADLQAN